MFKKILLKFRELTLKTNIFEKLKISLISELIFQKCVFAKIMNFREKCLWDGNVRETKFY